MNGKIKQNESIAMCRHEITTNLSKIIYKSSKLIKSGGRFYIVIPSSRLSECVVLLNQNKFEVKNMEICNNKGNATICLIESVKDAKSGVKIRIIEESL